MQGKHVHRVGEKQQQAEWRPHLGSLMLLAPGRPDGPAAAVRGLFVARVAHPRVAGCCGHRGPAVRPGRGGSSEGVSLAARPGRGGAGGWAALNPRGARAGACGPACPTQPHAPRTCTGRLQVHTWPRSTAHSHVQTLHQHPPSATSGSSPSSPRTLLACFSVPNVCPLTVWPPTLHSCQELGPFLARCPHLALWCPAR